jgi:aminoglycoside phosphotransferase (APT) family kinase protein
VRDVLDQLEAFLLAQLPPECALEISGLHRSAGGSSKENWAFDATITVGRVSTRHPLLLRRDPPSGVVATGQQQEFLLLQALEPTALPVAGVRWLDATGEWLERPSAVVDRRQGRASRSALRVADPLGLGASGQLRLAAEMVNVLAAIHAVDVDATGVATILPTCGPSPGTHEIDRWERELDEQELEPQPALRAALRWLRAHVPDPPDRLHLVHGDFRPGNVLVHEGRLEVVLDWELAHLGDPVDDLGWYCSSVYAREHFLPGTWQPADLLRRYEERSGTPVAIERLHFWQVLSTFRLAVMALTGVRLFCEGKTTRPAAPASRVVDQVLTDAVAVT